MGTNLSLCSGYGGLDFAVERLTGNKTIFYAENNPAAARVMAARFPEAHNLGDIKEADWTAAAALWEIDSLTAGFPCQGLSNAGLRKGLADERSGIWKYVAEAVRHVRPRLVFLENVAAIRSRGLGEVLADLAEIGYDARWLCLRASDIGAPHQRDRWFCVATPHAQGVGRPARRSESAEQPGRLRRPSGGSGEPAADADSPGLEVRGVQPARTELAPAERDDPSPEDADGEPRDERLCAAPGEAQGRGAWPHPGRRGELSPAAWWGEYLPAIRRWEHLTGWPAPAPTEIGPRGGRRLAASFAEWLMGLPPGWVTDVPGLDRAQQLHAIGNGVVPQQAVEAYRLLLSTLSRIVS